MERDRKTYTIYKITAPDGFCYIGYTSMTVSERWRHHKDRAFKGESIGHPFYDRIREYQGNNFTVKGIYRTEDRFTAMKLEEKTIASVPEELSANISSGGLNDGKEGRHIAWEKINATAESRNAYLQKLSATKLSNDWSDYKKLSEQALEWRKQHPREAYKQCYRAIRIARRSKNMKPPEEPLPLKERLLRKYKRNELKSKYVTEIWKNRDDASHKAIGQKISDKQKKHMAALSSEERSEITRKARESIDRKKQGKAASDGIKKWWEQLRQDPERYAAYIERRKLTRKKTMAEKKENR